MAYKKAFIPQLWLMELSLEGEWSGIKYIVFFSEDPLISSKHLLSICQWNTFYYHGFGDGNPGSTKLIMTYLDAYIVK